MPLIPWLKKVFGAKPAPETKKNKELTDEQLAFLKVQYKKINDDVSKISELKRKENEKYIEEKNSKCPSCGSKNVNDRIKRFEGKIDGSSSGYGWSALSFGESYSSGSIKGRFDTNEVNKCNDCENEWKKEKGTLNYYSGDIIESELNNIKYFFRNLKSAKNATWVKTDLKEKYDNLEDKKAAMLKDATEGTWAYSVKRFWSHYPIELIDKLVEERFLRYDMERWVEHYDYSALREILKLRTIDEFLK